MRVLYIECNMGAAGDMLISALSEIHPDPEGFLERLNSAGIPKVSVTRKNAEKCGILGTHIEVRVDSETEDGHHHHHHSGLGDIEEIINGLDISADVKKDAVSVYRIIAEAESLAHGCEMSDIHFHEVGTLDAVADVVGVCMLIREIAPDKIISSPVHVGSGSVHCVHGILPVPAPATAHILKDVTIYGGEINGELCTPTGAALLKYFASEFGAMPPIRVNKIGYGMGTKDFERANCVRVLLGETDVEEDEIIELCCNLDDMTGEEIGFAVERLFEAGAPEVFTSSVYMKKNRPGTLLTCICKKEQREEMVRLIFKYTTTIGVRENICRRYILERGEETMATDFGSVRLKKSEGYGTSKSKPEYDDVSRLAKENKVSLWDIKRTINRRD